MHKAALPGIPFVSRIINEIYNTSSPNKYDHKFSKNKGASNKKVLVSSLKINIQVFNV